MTEEICLVEVSVRFVTSGELEWSSKLDDYLWETEPQTKPIEPSDLQSEFWNTFQSPQDVYFTADNCCLSFRTFGQSANQGYSNPFDWLIEIGIDEEGLFKDYLPGLKKMALFILGELNKKKLKEFPQEFPQEKPSNYINFVTAWRYHGFQTPETSYGGGDWEDEWELIGAVNLEKTPFPIMKIGDDNG